MATDPIVVEPNPNAPVAPTPPPVQPTEPPPDETASAAGNGLPESLIKIPAIQGLLAGVPPAVSMSLKGSHDREEVKLVSTNQDALKEAGFQFYRSLNGGIGVMYNALKIHPQDLQAADRAGKLTQLAPDFDLVNHEIGKSGIDHPILKAQSPSAVLPSPVSAAAPPQAASDQMALVPPAPAAVARKLAAQRVLNMTPGAPSSGPSPGAGRLTNAILKPVV